MGTLFLASSPLYQGAGSTQELMQEIGLHLKGDILLVISTSVANSSYFQEELQPLLESFTQKNRNAGQGRKRGAKLHEGSNQHGFDLFYVHPNGEPSPDLIDSWVQQFPSVSVVIGIGGGSALDGAKAFAAASTMEGSVELYLEGVGSQKPSGTRKSLYLIPSTAGTGSEATTNAVLSKVGSSGYKKSLRHPNYLPDAVALDPYLLMGAPSKIIAASGMDAVTQLIESSVSTQATVASLGMSRAGLLAMRDSLKRCFDGEAKIEEYTNLLYGAYCSGIALAHAGLGVVHGAASVLGGYREIPHGVLCGTLIPHATELICTRTKEFLGSKLTLPYQSTDAKQEDGALLLMYQRYAEIGVLLGAPSLEEGVPFLIHWLHQKKRYFALPGFREFGFSLEELMTLVSKTSNKHAPFPLEEEDVALLYEQCW